MPTYEYECRRCGRRLEIMRRLSDPPLTECPECGGELRKLVSAPAFHLKGSGWYVTDYARKGGEGAKSGEAGQGGEAKAGDAASEPGKAGDAKGGGGEAGPAKETTPSAPAAGGAAGSPGGASTAGSK